MIRLLILLLLALALVGCSNSSSLDELPPIVTPGPDPEPTFEAFFRDAFANPDPEPLEFNLIAFADNGELANFDDLLVPDPDG